jgi:hypothetical protein
MKCPHENVSQEWRDDAEVSVPACMVNLMAPIQIRVESCGFEPATRFRHMDATMNRFESAEITARSEHARPEDRLVTNRIGCDCGNERHDGIYLEEHRKSEPEGLPSDEAFVLAAIMVSVMHFMPRIRSVILAIGAVQNEGVNSVLYEGTDDEIEAERNENGLNCGIHSAEMWCAVDLIWVMD